MNYYIVMKLTSIIIIGLIIVLKKPTEMILDQQVILFSREFIKMKSKYKTSWE